MFVDAFVQARLLAELEPAARQMWEENFEGVSVFGCAVCAAMRLSVAPRQNPMAEWSQFMAAYAKAVRGQAVNESGLRYLLGKACW